MIYLLFIPLIIYTIVVIASEISMNNNCAGMEIKYGIYNEHPPVVEKRRKIAVIYGCITAILTWMCLHSITPDAESWLYYKYLWLIVLVFSIVTGTISYRSALLMICQPFQALIIALMFAILLNVKYSLFNVLKFLGHPALVYMVSFIIAFIVMMIVTYLSNNNLLSVNNKIKSNTLLPWPKWDMTKDVYDMITKEVDAIKYFLPKNDNNLFDDLKYQKVYDVLDKKTNEDVPCVDITYEGMSGNELLNYTPPFEIIDSPAELERKFGVKGKVAILREFISGKEVTRFGYDAIDKGDTYIKDTKTERVYATESGEIYVGQNMFHFNENGSSTNAGLETFTKLKETDKRYKTYKKDYNKKVFEIERQSLKLREVLKQIYVQKGDYRKLVNERIESYNTPEKLESIVEDRFKPGWWVECVKNNWNWNDILKIGDDILTVPKIHVYIKYNGKIYEIDNTLNMTPVK